MKVVFLQDVPNAGKTGEVRDVADGYGKNYLIPHKLAAAADALMMSQVKAQMQAKDRMAAKTEAELQDWASQLEGKELTLEGKTGGKERLYGSITTTDISLAIKKALKLDIDKRVIELPEPIHKLGTYEVAVRLSKDIMPKVKVTVKEKAA